MQVIIWPAFLLLLSGSTILLFPEATLAVIAELRRRYRLHLINRCGKKATAAFINDMRAKYERKGYDMEGFDEVIEEYKAELIYRLGTRCANDFLGEPSILERYY
jgi:hypothetical protein